ncbi:hypothetical protein PXH69_22010 [Rhodococcus qingshengii]|uniref:SMI1/KNR4 family protein n=1 Tax=Rhodococcus qingshengii TaxID=334542 RepID=A0AAW6LRU1_RHOSG|nr:hypothetical protein [Rhodococcus qingshengii]MDE8647655.1 hypothetical protein [Rhodococcus qingshengii]
MTEIRGKERTDQRTVSPAVGSMGDVVDLEHVARFVGAAELVEIDDLTSQGRRQLPEYWLHALSGDRAWRVAEVLKRWDDFGRPIMSDTYKTISASLVDVALLKSRGEWFLLYRMTAAGGGDMYYLGGRPVTDDEDVPAVWHHFPVSLTRFYAHLHNGWYDIAGRTVGPLPLGEMFRIDAFEWGILDGLAPDEYPEPSRCVATFHSGGGGYLCLYVDGDAVRGVVWSSDEAPYLVDYSTYLDIWTNVGLGA